MPHKCMHSILDRLSPLSKCRPRKCSLKATWKWAWTNQERILAKIRNILNSRSLKMPTEQTWIFQAMTWNKIKNTSIFRKIFNLAAGTWTNWCSKPQRRVRRCSRSHRPLSTLNRTSFALKITDGSKLLWVLLLILTWTQDLSITTTRSITAKGSSCSSIWTTHWRRPLMSSKILRFKLWRTWRRRGIL